MPDPLLLYSTNTWIAYRIAERYFRGEHYVWCTPDFNSKSRPVHAATTPPSSLPGKIYLDLQADVTGGDRHSAKIEANKIGLLKGATNKRQNGIITDQDERDIVAILDSSQIQDFRPLLYIIPFPLVASLIREVPVAERAHPLSIEYIIESLPSALFDVIDL